jgi:Zn-dependent protease with chaperone function
MIRPVPVTSAYRLSVALAALAMIVAPLVYVGFVGLVAWAVWLWAVVAFQFAGNAVTLMIYLAVLGAGLTVLLFLAKVFFSPPRIDRNFTPLDLTCHPLLADLIRRVCAATGAPFPAEVAVDMSMNGAASLIHPIRGLFTNEYRLTLGLPLIAVSDRQHMAHMIAHEVGHFSQGGAMRVRQLIHWSQYYLCQLVDGRDRWDIWLSGQSSGGSYLMRFFAWCASGGIRLSRLVLRLLLKGTLLINARMSREMEFHADLYAIRVAGSHAFAQSVETLAGGGAAMQRAMQIAQRASADGRCPDDFPILVAAIFALYTPEERREFARLGRYTIGLDYDTHPDDTDRLDRSDRENESGALAEHGPASELFDNFAALCRAQSLKFYEAEPRELVPAAALLDEDQQRDAQDAGRIDFFGAVYDGPVWLRLVACEPVADSDWAAVIDAGDKARDTTLNFFGNIVSGYSKMVVASVILRRLDSDLPVDWMNVELEPCDDDLARHRMYVAERAYEETLAEFHTLAKPILRRLQAAWDRRESLPQTSRDRFAAWLDLLRALQDADSPTTRLALDLSVLSDLGGAIADNLQKPAFMQTIQSEFEGAIRHAARLEEALEAIPYPAAADSNLRAFAIPEPFESDSGVFGFLGVYTAALSRLRDLRLRAMGEVAELALAVEATRAPEAE